MPGLCPYEIAWVDFPDKSGTFHKYLECAGRGTCDRSTGDCQCFDGYTGKACQRTTCPNDCSGHGVCAYLEDHYISWSEYYDGQDNKHYGLGDKNIKFDPTNSAWDTGKTRGCICDPQWTDVDCSRRMCPKGTDILHERACTTSTAQQQVQTIYLKADPTKPYTPAPWQSPGRLYKTPDHTSYGNVSSFFNLTFALTFKSTLNETYTTIPIIFDTPNTLAQLEADVEYALESLPHKVIDDVTVSTAYASDYIDPAYQSPNPLPVNISISITFTGATVQGPQNLVQVVDYYCGDGCFPKTEGLPIKHYWDLSYVKETVASDYNNYECGRRGKCDYSTGLCKCFDGYVGEACGTQTALI